MTRFNSAMMAVLALASVSTAAPLAAQNASVTAAAEASLPSGASYGGLALKGLTVGIGVSITTGGSASGQFHAVLQGTSLLGVAQEVVVQGEVSAGSVADGVATFSGTAAVKIGDAVSVASVPFTATASTSGVKLTLDTSALPTATVTAGSITVRNP